MTKILLLGIGRWGSNHLRVLHSLPVELFVAETDPKRLDAARQLGLGDQHLTTDHRKFAANVDGAVVVTPAQTHYDLCREFLEAGKDVFVEKPIALHSKDARALVELAEQRKRLLQVGHIFRFDPASKWLRDAVAEGKFGKLKILRGDFRNKFPSNPPAGTNNCRPFCGENSTVTGVGLTLSYSTITVLFEPTTLVGTDNVWTLPASTACRLSHGMAASGAPTRHSPATDTFSVFDPAN